MRVLLFVLVVLIIGMLLVVVIAKKRRNSPDNLLAPPYVKKTPLTGPEQEMYRRLKKAVPECEVLAQVALSSLVEVKKRDDWRRWFNRISQKSVDFVLCLPQDFSVVAVIELDDMSHALVDRQRADTAKDVALRVAGHPILRYKRHDMPTVEEIRESIAGSI